MDKKIVLVSLLTKAMLKLSKYQYLDNFLKSIYSLFQVSSATLFPWQSKCCGQSASFDGRLQSCPCNDGQVLDIPDLYADCCLSPDGDNTPYNTRHSFCCNGKVYILKLICFCLLLFVSATCKILLFNYYLHSSKARIHC